MMQLQDPQYKSADGSALRIWRDAAQNRFLSEREGVAVFDDVIYVEVISPGSGNSSPVFELERTFDSRMNYVDERTGEPKTLRGAKYEELKQFVEDFKKSETGGDSSLAGTPLEEWPAMNRSLVATLKAQGVFTVDALAVLPDGKLNIVGPDGRSWRDKAAAYLANAKDGSHATKLAADLDALRITTAAGQEREKALAEQVQALTAQIAAGGGKATTPAGTSKPADTTATKTAADAIAEVAASQAQPVAAAGETLVPAKAPEVAALPII